MSVGKIRNPGFINLIFRYIDTICCQDRIYAILVTMIELAILGLLKEGPMHGYDLRKRLKNDFGPLANISYGSLYPALERLEKAGAITQVGRTGQNITAPVFTTGSLEGERASFMAKRATAKAVAAISGHSTRAKKVFTITEKGDLLFEELLEDPVSRDDPRGFNLRLGFAKHLSPTARIRMLERRRLQLIDRFETSKKSLGQPHRLLDEYELAIAKHSLEIVALDLQWVESLLEKENLRNTSNSNPVGKSNTAPGETAPIEDIRAADKVVSVKKVNQEASFHPQVETPV